jgi:hypothetical protein
MKVLGVAMIVLCCLAHDHLVEAVNATNATTTTTTTTGQTSPKTTTFRNSGSLPATTPKPTTTTGARTTQPTGSFYSGWSCVCLNPPQFYAQAELNISLVDCFSFLFNLARVAGIDPLSLCLPRNNFDRSFTLYLGCIDDPQSTTGTAEACITTLLNLSPEQLNSAGLGPTIQTYEPPQPVIGSPAARMGSYAATVVLLSLLVVMGW